MCDHVVEDVLGCDLKISNNQLVVMISYLISNLSSSSADTSNVTLKDVWKLKENPSAMSYNLLIGNSEDLVDELRKFKSGACIVDLSVQCRDCDSLRSVASSLGQQVSLYCSTGPSVKVASTENKCKSMVSAMKSDLLAGCNYTDKSVGAVSTKAIAISYRVVEPYCHSSIELTPENLLALSACGQLHTDFASSASTPPPIVIGCTPMYTNHQQVLTALEAAGADLSRVVFNHTTLTSSSVEYWHSLLTSHPCSLCVDCFGYAATFSPSEGPMFPTDAEMLSAVVELCRRGHTSRIILSLSVYCKIQLTAYGGHGYQYLERVIKPRLEALGVDSATVQQLCGSNLMELLKWRQPVVEKVKEIETLPCHICGKAFPAASDYFSKFQFVYCSSKCLAEHRKTNFKQ